MAGFYLTGQNAVVELTDGGVQDGSPTWGTPVTVSGDTLKSISGNGTVDTAKFPVLGKNRNTTQAMRGEDQLTVDLFVDDGGHLFPFCQGNYMRVRWKELGAMASFREKIGVVTSWEFDLPDGATTEKLVIMCDANGATGA